MAAGTVKSNDGFQAELSRSQPIVAMAPSAQLASCPEPAIFIESQSCGEVATLVEPPFSTPKTPLSGVLNPSVLDGSWIEACIKAVTGRAGVAGAQRPTRGGSHGRVCLLSPFVNPCYMLRRIGCGGSAVGTPNHALPAGIHR